MEWHGAGSETGGQREHRRGLAATEMGKGGDTGGQGTEVSVPGSQRGGADPQGGAGKPVEALEGAGKGQGEEREEEGRGGGRKGRRTPTWRMACSFSENF